MINLLLISIAIFCASSNGVILHSFGLKRKNSVSDLFFYNGGMMGAWMITLTAWMLLSGTTNFCWLTLAYGAAYGILISSFQFSKALAMSLGPISLTSLIGSSAFTFPIAYDMIVYGIMPDIFQVSGILIIVVALILCVNPRITGQKITVKWLIATFFYVTIGGTTGIYLRVFSKSPISGDTNQMMFIAAVIGCIFYLLTGRLLKKKNSPPFFVKSNLIYMFCAGFVNCIYTRMGFLLSPRIPSAIYFPVLNGAIVILTAVAGVFLFHEKLKKIQIVGICLALLGLLVNGGGKAICEVLARAM